MQKPSNRDHVAPSGKVADPIGSERDLGRLVQAMREGEVSALSRLYQLTVRQVSAIAHERLRSREDAEEIVLDVYLYAWRRSDAYDAGRGSVEAWLSIMTKYRAIDRLRRRRLALSFDDPTQGMLTLLTAATEGPEQALVSFQASLAIERALESLSEERRTVVRLAFVDQLTHEEIAAVVGKPLGTVKSHVRRALSAMQRHLTSHT